MTFNNVSYISDIKLGDYVFVKLEKEYAPASVKRLWKLKKIKNKNGDVIAQFDQICEFEAIELPKFLALDLFILNMKLLNKCVKQTKGLSFIEISLLDKDYFEELASKPDELKNILKIKTIIDNLLNAMIVQLLQIIKMFNFIKRMIYGI